MGTEQKIPKIAVDTADVPGPERLALWSRVLPSYTVLLPSGVDEFSGNAESWLVGNLIISFSRLSPLRYIRTPAQVRADELDHVVVLLLKKGTSNGDMAGKHFTAGPGELLLQSLAHPLDVVASSVESVSIRMPQALIEPAIADITRLHGAILDGPIARLLADHMLSLVDHLDDLDAKDVPAAVKTTTQIVQATLAAQYAPGNQQFERPQSDIHYRSRRYIDEHLASRDLNPSAICRALGVSRATLYRSFATRGGIAAHIKRRRLEAAHVRLNDPNDGRSIASIAYEYGFATNAHFSRAFREEYGYSPRAARSGAGTVFDVTDGDKEKITLYRGWLQKLR